MEFSEKNHNAGGSTSMTGEERLRRAVDVVKQGLSDASWTDSIPEDTIAEFRKEQEQLLFPVLPRRRRPGFADDAVSLAVELTLGRRKEMRRLWQEMEVVELEDLFTFNFLANDLTLFVYHADPLRITTVEGYVAWYSCLVGAWTALKPDMTPLWRKLPTAISAWRLVPPSMSTNEARRNTDDLAAAMESAGLDQNIVERMTPLMFEHSTSPGNDEIRTIARRMEAGHLRNLTTLHRTAEYVIKLSLPSDAVKPLRAIMAQATYRGLLIGHRMDKRSP